MAEKDGGPAFPSLEIYEGYNRDRERYEVQSETATGMSLRDYFAAKALMSLLPLFATGTLGLKAGGKVTEDHIAEQSYAFADAMLVERSKPRPAPAAVGLSVEPHPDGERA
jgi:hypothetical protein